MRVLPLAAVVFLLPFASVVPASPLACGSPCVIETNHLGYLPPLAEVASGAAVAWRSTGGGHIQSDVGLAEACFVTDVARGETSDPAVFRIVAGALRATTLALGEDVLCENAQPLPDGAFALHYECVLHANMRGALVVRPA